MPDSLNAPTATVRPLAERPRIGLTLMLDMPERDDHVPRFGMNRTYFEAIRRAGGIPVALAPGDPEEMGIFLAQDGRDAQLALDGLCLAGGGDPDPALYGQTRRPYCGRPEPERDAMEMELLLRVRATELPVLAICRGVQILNVAWGGTLFQDIGHECPNAQEHYFTAAKGFPRNHRAHEIRIDEGTCLRSILGAPGHPVNSIHHQALDRIAPGLRVVARAPDGIVEAVELAPPEDSRRFLVGVQFHPEDLTELASIRRLFAAFVDAAAAVRRGRRMARGRS
jgi:putative glutamine amidotransferase